MTDEEPIPGESEQAFEAPRTGSAERGEPELGRWLERFGLEVSPSNLEALRLQAEIRQIPVEEADIAKALEQHHHDRSDKTARQALAEAMRKADVTTIMHAEGLTVGDHVAAVLAAAEALPDLSEEDRRDLRLLVLYHDLGKAEVATSKKNLDQNNKQRAKGRLVVSMMGHADPGQIPDSWPRIEAGLRVNGVSDEALPRYLKVIEKHMEFLAKITPEFLTKINPNDESQPDPKAVKQLYDFIHQLGSTDEERRWVFEKLNLLEHADATGTFEALLTEAGSVELRPKSISENPNGTLTILWARYEGEVKRVARAEAVKATIVEVLVGQSMGDYLALLGIPRGPEMGAAQRRIEAVVGAFVGGEAQGPAPDRAAALAQLRAQMDEAVRSS